MSRIKRTSFWNPPLVAFETQRRRGAPCEAPRFAVGLSCILASPLPSGDKLPGYGQQDDGGKAGNQQEHGGRCTLKLSKRAGEGLDGEEQQYQAEGSYQPLVPGQADVQKITFYSN